MVADRARYAAGLHLLAKLLPERPSRIVRLKSLSQRLEDGYAVGRFLDALLLSHAALLRLSGTKYRRNPPAPPSIVRGGDRPRKYSRIRGPPPRTASPHRRRDVH